MTAREGTPVFLCSVGGETIAGGLNPELLRIEHEYGLKPFAAANGRSTRSGPGKWLNVADTGYLSPHELRLPYSQESPLLDPQGRRLGHYPPTGGRLSDR